MAYLAILPKGPSNYDPDRHTKRALDRRNWVLGEMLRNGFIDQAQHDSAVASPLGTVPRQTPKFERRRRLFRRGSPPPADRQVRRDRGGPYSVYSGGLWVRTSLDPKIQQYAQKALRDGLLRYDRGRGWSGRSAMSRSRATTGSRRCSTPISARLRGLARAIVIARAAIRADRLLRRQTGTLPIWAATMPVRGEGGRLSTRSSKVGDILAVAPEGGAFALRSCPRSRAAWWSRTRAPAASWRCRAASIRASSVQPRDPGDAPAGLDDQADRLCRRARQGMTPASIIVDGPFCVYQGAALGQKCFRNFGGGGGAGPHTMRWGVEQSRNLMTVRAAKRRPAWTMSSTLMDRIGVGKYPPYLSYALGAGETTVMRWSTPIRSSPIRAARSIRRR
jgi:penicillin-binding protein 1A